MVDEFRTRFYDLTRREWPFKEVEPPYDSDMWWPHLTRVRWDADLVFVIDVGDGLPGAVRDLQLQLIAEFHNGEPDLNKAAP